MFEKEPTTGPGQFYSLMTFDNDSVDDDNIVILSPCLTASLQKWKRGGETSGSTSEPAARLTREETDPICLRFTSGVPKLWTPAPRTAAPQLGVPSCAGPITTSGRFMKWPKGKPKVVLAVDWYVSFPCLAFDVVIL